MAPVKNKKKTGQSKKLPRGFAKNILDHAPLPILVTDHNVKIIYINQQFRNLTGYSLSDLRGKNPRVLSAGKTPRSVYIHLWETLLRKKVWEGEVMNRAKDGREYWEMLSIAPVMTARGHVTHFVAMCEDITQRHGDDEKMKEDIQLYKKQAHTDSLTGVDNRRSLMRKIDAEISRAARYRHPLSVIMADLDYFKKINDTHGHVVGDVVLRSVARILQKNVRASDVLGRYGGDEFVAVLPETGLKGAIMAAERSLKMVKEYRENVLSAPTPLGVSLGVVCFEKAEGLDRRRLLEETDRVLLRAKAEGKNRVVAACFNESVSAAG